MLKNYFRIAWRNLLKHKVFSFINLGGLVIGITSVMLIGIYIQSELSYDGFQANRNTIYRVGVRTIQDGNLAGDSPEFTAPFSMEAKNRFPEIKDYCRISDNHQAWLSYEDKNMKSAGITYADPSFFGIFSCKLLSGSTSALRNPFSIVLSENLAKRIFGNTDAVGKMISLDGKTNYLVTGIAENAPANSTIQFDAVIPMSTLYQDAANKMDWNGGWRYQHYLQLQPGAKATDLEKKFTSFMWANYNEKFAGTARIDAYLQPFSKIHLYYSSDSENTRTNLYIFGIVALLILVIACINYVNLSIARASARFKEIGVRKVLGAAWIQLVKQFMGETLLVTLVAVTISGILTVGLFPLYKEISGKTLLINADEIIFIGILMLSLIVLVSVTAGAYLSFYLASMRPLNLLRMQLPKSGKQTFGRALMVFQFIIAISLISSVLIVQMQLSYIKNKPIGFDKEKLIILPLTGDVVQDKAPALKQQVASIAGVSNISAMSEIPYDNITQNGFLPEGNKNYLMVHQLDADADFLKTMNIELLEGDFFSDASAANNDGYVINQALADEIGWKDPLHKTISRDNVHKVIGVVKNFHFASMHDKIGPLIITNKPWRNKYDYLAIKYNTANPSLLIDQLRVIWKQNVSGAPFDYWFLDDAYNQLYKSEEKFKALFFYFSMVSILLSMAGVFGLVLLNIRQRTKEIGIRKILGAGVYDIIALTVKNFALLIIAASVIAVPVAWYYANKWLENFAYRIDLHWWMFALSGLMVICFSFIIMSIQTGKAAMTNPVRSLRNE